MWMKISEEMHTFVKLTMPIADYFPESEKWWTTFDQSYAEFSISIHLSKLKLLQNELKQGKAYSQQTLKGKDKDQYENWKFEDSPNQRHEEIVSKANYINDLILECKYLLK